MAPNKKLLKSKEPRSRAELADFLTGLAERIREGTVTLRQGNEDVVLDLPGVLTVEMEVTEQQRRRGLKREIDIEIEWYADADGPLEGGVELV